MSQIEVRYTSVSLHLIEGVMVRADGQRVIQLDRPNLHASVGPETVDPFPNFNEISAAGVLLLQTLFKKAGR
jgi:hypothetical protein